MHRRNLHRHGTRNHTDHSVFGCGQCERSFARSANLEKHKRTCTGGQVTVAVPAAKKRRVGVATKSKLQIIYQHWRRL